MTTRGQILLRFNTKALIERITVHKDGISIKWKSTGMTKLLRDTVRQHAYKEAA